MLKHLRYSQIEKYAKKYELRPGMGLAAPQVGINKNFFVVCYEVSNGKFEDYILINPKVISYSEEMIYAGEGEGCLSINREVDGIVPRVATHRGCERARHVALLMQDVVDLETNRGGLAF